MHRWADRGDRGPTPGPPDAVERADALAHALRAAFGTALRCDATALPSGAVDATVRNGTSVAAVQVNPEGDRWGVSVDWVDAEVTTAHDHVVASVDEVVAALRARWPASG